MSRDLVVTIRLPEESPETYIRLTKACRESARPILEDPLLEELAAAVVWQLIDQASRARLEGRTSVSPTLELEPEHVELAREFARQRRDSVPIAESPDPRIDELLHRCSDRVAAAFASSPEHAGRT